MEGAETGLSLPGPLPHWLPRGVGDGVGGLALPSPRRNRTFQPRPHPLLLSVLRSSLRNALSAGPCWPGQSPVTCAVTVMGQTLHLASSPGEGQGAPGGQGRSFPWGGGAVSPRAQDGHKLVRGKDSGQSGLAFPAPRACSVPRDTALSKPRPRSSLFPPTWPIPRRPNSTPSNSCVCSAACGERTLSPAPPWRPGSDTDPSGGALTF